MIKSIMKSEMFLRLPCAPATQDDAQLGQDLLDTLAAHKNTCVGMAANMIGVAKRAIVFDCAGKPRLMYNPEIVSKQGPYQVKEGCLSLQGVRETTRYKRIKVSFLDEHFCQKTESFTDYTAQIIQHEIDHCNSIII